MKIAIIDDELHNRLVIKRIIENNCTGTSIIIEEGIIDKAIDAINNKKPDLIFLDIRLKNGTGFDILEALSYKPKIIFTTAYSEYALQAIKVQALEYLLKPIDEKELIDSITKTRQLLFSKDSTKINEYNYTIFGKSYSLNYDLICYFERLGSETNIVTENEKILLSKDIGEIENELPAHKFYRTHNDYIVNLKKIKSVEMNENGHINLSSNVTIPVAENKLHDFLNFIKSENFF